MTITPKARSLGLAAGISLGLLIAVQSADQIAVQGTPQSDDATAQFRLFMAILFGALLLALNVGMTFYLRRKNAIDQRGLAVMWLPPLAALLLTPAYNEVASRQHEAILRAHPPIAEWHVNLTGRTFWLAPEVGPFPHDAKPEAIRLMYRQQSRDNTTDPMREYAGLLPAPGFRHLTVFSAPRGVAPASKPVAIGPIPALKLIEPAFPYGGGPVVSYMYYHYPDRIDVAPALHLYKIERNDNPTARVPFVVFYPRNLAGPPIVRIEIDGQALQLESAVFAHSGDKDDRRLCQIPGAPAINWLNAHLKIRWQVAQANPAWREATVARPSLVHMGSARSSVKRNAVHLYFLADGSVALQREQILGLDDEAPGVRFTEPPQLTTPIPCGTAQDVYREHEAYRKAR